MSSFKPSSWTSERAFLLGGVLAFFLSALLLGASQVLALQPPQEQPSEPLAGAAVVVDGDTLDIAGERVRLEGVDAPEMSQSCQRADGQDWACGREAHRLLSGLTDGQTVACDRKGADKYGRTLAVCYVAGDDINAVLVKSGLARAFVKYSDAYTAEEAAARSARAGLWQGEHTSPWDYRQNRWQTAEVKAPSGCAIKGNVSNRGQIYHVPWSAWYDKVKVEPARGERWFCSEAEALAAGWRPAVQR